MRFAFRLLAAVVIAAGVASCSDTKSIDMPIGAGKHPAKIALNPIFSPAATTISAALGEFGITYDHVRITIRNNPDTNVVVADTTVAFGPTSNALTLDLTVPVDQDGQIFNALVRYTGPTGVVFSGTLLVQSHAPDQPAPEQQSLVLNFVGPGAKLKTITLSPKPVNLVGSQSVAVTATATDSSGGSLAVPPLVFTSSDATIATVSGSATTYNAQSFGKRGSARIIATTPTGIADTLTANVTLPATKIVLVSGGSQTGPAGAALPNPAVVQVNASDDVPIPGVSVTFAAPTGGSVGTTTVTTDAKGQASSTMTLATGTGPQSFLATAAGFNVPIPQTSIAGPISTSQTVISATSPILADNTVNSVVTVQARDEYQNLITTGGATISLSTTLGHFGNGRTAPTTIVATDKGDGTYTAQLFSSIGGAATVTGTIGSTAIKSSATVTFVAGTLDHFDVTTTTGTAIGPTVQTATAITVKITARDAANNVIPSFTGQPKIRVTNSTLTPDSVVVAPAAVSGVTTTNVMFGTPGQNVTLDVTGTLGQNTVVSHSATFAVTPAPAAGLTASKPVYVNEFDTTPTDLPIIFVKDAAGNPIANQAVGFTMIAVPKGSGSGTCTFSGGANTLTVSTSVDGEVAFSPSGENVIVVDSRTSSPYSCILLAQTSTPTGLPLTLFVPIVIRPNGGGAVTWIGTAGDGKWSNPANWYLGVAPTITSTVFIPLATSIPFSSTPATPTLSAPTTIQNIDVEDGGNVDLGGNALTVNGYIDARLVGSIANGIVNANAGSEATLSGSLPNLNCTGVEYGIPQIVQISGSVTNSACRFLLSSATMAVAGNYTQTGTGTVAMGGSGLLTVTGDAVFAGGSETDILGEGTLMVGGSLSQSGNPTALTTFGTHVTRLSPAGSVDRTLSFGSPATSTLGQLELVVTSSSALTVSSQIQVGSLLSIIAATGGTLNFANGMVNTTNGPIMVTATGLTIGLAGTINTSGLTFTTNSSVTLTGALDGLSFGSTGAIAFQSGAHVTIDATGTLNAPGGGCTRGNNVVFDGKNTQAVGILNQVCRAP